MTIGLCPASLTSLTWSTKCVYCLFSRFSAHRTFIPMGLLSSRGINIILALLLVARFVLSNRISSTAATAPTDGETNSSFDASCELRKSLEFRTGRAQFIESGPPGTDERSEKHVQLLIKKDQCRRHGRSDAKKFKQRSCIEQKKLGKTSKPLEKNEATQICIRFYQVYRRQAEKEQNTNSHKACRSGYLAGCVNWMTEKLYY